MVYKTKFQRDLRKLTKERGGAINFHAHLDRAETLDDIYLSHVGLHPMKASAYPLRMKQNLTGDLHLGPAYRADDLRRRMSRLLNAMYRDFGVRQVWSLIDTTADIDMRAFDVALVLRDEMKDKIELRVGSYPIFGFKDDEPERWKTFERASGDADFLAGLPERDEKEGHVGYKEHLRRILYLATELDKPVQVHVDQANEPSEHGTEELIHATDYCIPPDMRYMKDGSPRVWAVHAISPSCYDDSRFGDLLDGLCDTGVGVICCPSAAISMKQKREITTPTHNSVARVLEMMAHEIPIRLGSDNISDVFVPSGTPDMYREAEELSNYSRFYDPDIWSKVLAGKELNEADRYSIETALNGRK